jgi:hypothetical protein
MSSLFDASAWSPSDMLARARQSNTPTFPEPFGIVQSWKSASPSLSQTNSTGQCRMLQPIKPGKLSLVLDCETPEIDIRDLTNEFSAEELNLEPIQGSFDHDPEYFEHFAIQDRIEKLEYIERELTEVLTTHQVAESNSSETKFEAPALSAPEFSSENSASNWNSPEFNLSEITPNQDDSEQCEAALADKVVHEISPFADEMTEIIFAHDKQVIYVDGRDGFQYIDLSCFDISQASFEANLIRVRTPQQNFDIDYRNVTHAVFSGNQEVELGAFD